MQLLDDILPCPVPMRSGCTGAMVQVGKMSCHQNLFASLWQCKLLLSLQLACDSNDNDTRGACHWQTQLVLVIHNQKLIGIWRCHSSHDHDRLQS